jgi:hypothetical protein
MESGSHLTSARMPEGEIQPNHSQRALVFPISLWSQQTALVFGNTQISYSR